MTNESTMEPNRWIDKRLVMALTGLTERQIKEYRHHAWVEGVHYKKASPKGKTGNTARLMYNRIEIDHYFDNNKKVA